MTFSIIVATSENNVIGRNNQLPWNAPLDMKHFREKTSFKTIVMGRKTFDSIGKPLPVRRNVVLTRDKKWARRGVRVFHSPLDLIQGVEGEEIMVIGGSDIYKEMLPFVDTIYRTKIHVTVEDGDAFFEVPSDFELTKNPYTLIDKNGLVCTFEVYKRKEEAK